MTVPIKVLIAHVGIKDLIAGIKEKYTVNQPIRGQYFLEVWNYKGNVGITAFVLKLQKSGLGTFVHKLTKHQKVWLFEIKTIQNDL